MQGLRRRGDCRRRRSGEGQAAPLGLVLDGAGAVVSGAQRRLLGVMRYDGCDVSVDVHPGRADADLAQPVLDGRRDLVQAVVEVLEHAFGAGTVGENCGSNY